MELEKAVGAKIRRLRKVRGLSQERLAQEASIDLRYLGGIERGEHSPTVNVVGRLANALGVDPSDLLKPD
jgi:transcriptional regulator with XRE-family HTH domain